MNPSRAFTARTIDDLKLILDAALSDSENVKSCLNCEKFNESSETCNQYGARPPARVIAFGCEEFLQNDK